MANDTTVKILDIEVKYSEAIKAIAKYREGIEEAKQAQKKLKDELKAGEISQEKYNREMEASRLYVKKQSDAIAVITKQVRNQIKAETEQKGSIIGLRAELSNLKMSYDSLSEAERKTAQGLTLARRIEATEKAIRNQTVTIEEAQSIMQREVHSINEAQEANKRLRAAVRSITDEEDKHGKIRKQLNEQIKKNTEYIKRNSDAYIQQKMDIGSYKTSIFEAFNQIKNGNNVLKNFGSMALNTGSLIKTGLSEPMKNLSVSTWSLIKGFIGAKIIGNILNGIASAFKNATKTAIDFEKANSKLAAILSTNIKGIKELRQQALLLGRETPYTASQVTALQTELAKLGFTKKEITDTTRAVLDFAKACDADLADAAKVAGVALRAFQMDSSEAERAVSAMSIGTTRSALSFSDYETALSTLGPITKTYGMELEDLIALMGILKNSGFDASSAATATRNILLNLSDENGKLAKSLGRSVKNIDDMAVAFRELKENGIDLAGTLELTDKRSVSAFNTFINNTNAISELRKQVTGCTEDFHSMVNTMSDNTVGAIAGLSSAWEGLELTIMESTGWIKEFVDGLKNVVDYVRYLVADWDQIRDDTLLKSTEEGTRLANEAISSNSRLATEYIGNAEAIWINRRESARSL